ncbi:MAG: Nramp family divalent metal transporter [Anaerolineae bacterium]|jgi:hypothetical protein
MATDKVPNKSTSKTARTDTVYQQGHDIPEPFALHSWRDYVKFLFGPGVIALGLGLGTGELISAPFLVVQMGPRLLWIALISILLQTLTSIIASKYTILTGEPVQLGINRLWIGKKTWTVIWIIMGSFTRLWPYYMALTGSTLAALFIGSVPGSDQRLLWSLMSVLGIAICMAPIFVGKKVMDTLAKLFFWLTTAVVIPLLIILTVLFVPGDVFREILKGFVSFGSIPANADWTTLAAVAGYAGLSAGAGMALSSYYRDHGFGMAQRVGYIGSLTAHQTTKLEVTGFMPPETPTNVSRLRTWWKYVNLELWPLFFAGSIITMAFPCALYYYFVPSGAATAADFGFTALLAQYMRTAFPAAWIILLLAFLGVFYVDGVASVDGGPRDFSNNIWNAFPGVSKRFKGDVRPLYYIILGIFVVVWLIMIAVGTQPHVMALMSGAFGTLQGVVFPIGMLGINYTLLPKSFRLKAWEVVVMAFAAVFYAFFFFNFVVTRFF